MNLYFARHGETLYNRDNKFQGLSDVPLTKEGKESIIKIANTSNKIKIDKLYVSNIFRAKETADIYQNFFDLDYQIDARLNEIDIGNFEGKFFKNLRRDYPNVFKQWELGNFQLVDIPNGESFLNLEKRVSSFLEDITSKKNAQLNILIVSHFVTIKSLISTALTKSLDISNTLKINLGNISKLTYEHNTGWTLSYMNLPVIN